MGRHSAPDEPELDPADAEGGPAQTAALDLGPPSGPPSRHAAASPDDQHTQRIAVVDAELLDAPRDADTDQIAPVAPPDPTPDSAAGETADKTVDKAADKAARADQKAQQKAAADAAKADEKARQKLEADAAKAARAEQKAAADAAKAQHKAAADAAKSEQKTGQKADKAAAPRRESNTRADLRLLRHNPAVRAQAIGAVVATFLIYTLLMLVTGMGNDFLKWVWIPIVLCGVLVGVVLDLAHRREEKRSGTSAEPPDGKHDDAQEPTHDVG